MPDAGKLSSLVASGTPGTEIRVGNIKAVRNADGTWSETTIDGARIEPRFPSLKLTRKRWWQFWSRS